MSYQPIDQAGRPKALFPTTRLDVRDFFFWRSWQGESVVRILYYVHMVLALIVFFAYMISGAIADGAAGFFLGLFIGLVVAIVMIVYARVICEVVLSVFSIRDNMERLATQGVAHVPQPQTTTYPTYPQVVPQPYQAL